MSTTGETMDNILAGLFCVVFWAVVVCWIYGLGPKLLDWMAARKWIAPPTEGIGQPSSWNALVIMSVIGGPLLAVCVLVATRSVLWAMVGPLALIAGIVVIGVVGTQVVDRQSGR